jgi:tripartite-type tricarboxylate transporter receptor subunit TctC
MVHVVYKGAAPSIAAVMAGEISVAFDGIASSLPHVKAGRLKALGISIRKRSSIAPNIPTIDEAGVKGFDSSAWMGMVSPRGTPDAVVRKLNEAANKVLTRAESRKRLMEYGAEPLGGTPAEFGEFIRSEYKKWGTVVAKTALPKE